MDVFPLNNSGKYNTSSKKKIASLIDNSARLIKEGQFNKAVSLCNDALNLDPTDASAHTNKGVAFVRLSQFEDAILCFDLALKYDPKLAVAWYNKASTKALQNEIPEAITLLGQAISINPRFSTTAKTDEDFLYLRSNPNFVALVGN